jgi:hypothetical protein
MDMIQETIDSSVKPAPVGTLFNEPGVTAKRFNLLVAAVAVIGVIVPFRLVS